VSATVPADQASNLAVYSDTAGTLILIGPKGWICRAEFGAEGSGGLVISPAGESIHKVPGSRGHVPSLSNAEAIEGYQTGASAPDGAALACPVIAAAATANARELKQACPHPTGETVLPKTPTEVAFYDPPGVAGEGAPSGGLVPAYGVVLYLPGKGKGTAYVSTCTLPAAQSAICTAVLNDFVARYG
jgi:hypothetical protein